MADVTEQDLKDFKKERLDVSEREVQKFQDNVVEKFAEYDRIILNLIERIYKLENP